MSDLDKLEATLAASANPTFITIATKFADSDVAVTMTFEGDSQVETVSGFQQIVERLQKPAMPLSSIEKLHKANLQRRRGGGA